MARRSSKNSGKKDQDQETPRDDVPVTDSAAGEPQAENPAAPEEEATGPEAAEDAAGPEGTARLDPKTDTSETDLGAVSGDDTVPAEPLDPETAAAETTDIATVPDADIDSTTGEDADPAPPEETVDADAGAAPPTEPPPELETPPEPAATRTVVERRGPGFVPLLLGGVVAAALGWLAASYDAIPGLARDDGTAEIEAALSRQSEALAGLQARIEELGPATAPEVDLSPVTERIDSLGARIDETAQSVGTLAERVSTLEERPVFTGDVAADAAEAAEAVAAMEEQMRAQEEETARLAAEAEAAQQEAAEAIAAAQAEAQAAAAVAEAEAALERLRLAVTEGASFADPLAAVSAVTEVPPPLASAADTGVASVEELQDRFPVAARAALPVALRETAGDGTMDRLGAFLQGQIGGRSIEPREGDSPDAILSRAQAAVSDGDLAAALSEIAALPEEAQTAMADWISAAQTRVEVTQALDTVAQSVTDTN